MTITPIVLAPDWIFVGKKVRVCVCACARARARVPVRVISSRYFRRCPIFFPFLCYAHGHAHAYKFTYAHKSFKQKPLKSSTQVLCLYKLLQPSLLCRSFAIWPFLTEYPSVHNISARNTHTHTLQQIDTKKSLQQVFTQTHKPFGRHKYLGICSKHGTLCCLRLEV